MNLMCKFKSKIRLELPDLFNITLHTISRDLNTLIYAKKHGSPKKLLCLV